LPSQRTYKKNSFISTKKKKVPRETEDQCLFLINKTLGLLIKFGQIHFTKNKQINLKKKITLILFKKKS